MKRIIAATLFAAVAVLGVGASSAAPLAGSSWTHPSHVSFQAHSKTWNTVR